jgi:hypothetical protein
MANNENIIKRTAFVHLVHPGHASATVATSNTGVFIPAGAIVTGMRMLAGGPVTAASLSNAVIGISVGSVSIGSNNNIISAKAVQTIPKSLTLAVSADGILIPSDTNSANRPGEIRIGYVSTGTAATGVTADYDLYVDYLYCSSHD